MEGIPPAEQIQQYIDLGWQLIPIRKGEKKPVEQEWQRFCTERRDPPLAAADFNGFNVGVALGPASQICCVDVDDEDSWEAFLVGSHHDIPTTRTHSSRPGRLHFIFKWPSGHHQLRTRMFPEWGFELRGIGGQIVIPPSIHPTTHKPYEVVSDAPVAELPAWLLEMWKDHTGPLDLKPADWPTSALQTMAQGNRNDTVFRAACRYLKYFSESEVSTLLEPHALRVGLEAKEFSSIMASAIKYRAYDDTCQITVAKDTPRMMGWSIHEFLSHPMQDPAWIVRPFISPGDIMFLTSDAGVGKTWLVVSMMLDIVRGAPWIGQFHTRPVKILYCDFDNHKRGDSIRRRLLKLCHAQEIFDPWGQIPQDSITILTRHDMPHAFSLYTKEGLPQFVEQIVKGKFDLVVLDTFTAVHGSPNENDASAMGKVMNSLRAIASETNSAFLITHHSRKPGANTPDTESRISYRGSTAIKGGADCMLELVADKDNNIKIRHTKFRHVEQVKDLTVRVRDVDGERGTIISMEDEDQIVSLRIEQLKGYLRTGKMWGHPELEKDADGWIRQSDIIKFASREGLGSDRPVRDALELLRLEKTLERKSLGPGKPNCWRRVPEKFDFMESEIYVDRG